MLRLEDFDKGTYREILMRFWRVFKGSTQKDLLSTSFDLDSNYQMVKGELCRKGAVFIKLDTKLLYEPDIGMSINAIRDEQGRTLLHFFVDLTRLRKDFLDTELTVKHFNDVIDSYLFTRGIGIYGNNAHIRSLTERIAKSGERVIGLLKIIEEIQERANKQHDKSALSCEMFRVLMIRIERFKETLTGLNDAEEIPDIVQKILPELAAMETIVKCPYFS